MSADFGTCDTSGGTTRALGSYVIDSATCRWVRMDPRHSGMALTSICGRRVAVDVASCWAVSHKCRPKRTFTAGALWVPRGSGTTVPRFRHGTVFRNGGRSGGCECVNE
eukprot:7047816-Prymnesium_polylepis.1